MALIAEIDVPEAPHGAVTVAATQLENKAAPKCRRRRMTDQLADVCHDRRPLVLAGDLTQYHRRRWLPGVAGRQMRRAAVCNAAQTHAADPVTLEDVDTGAVMNSARPIVIALVALSFNHLASAQDLARYRGYALESTVESVVDTSGARATDVKTLHERPAMIQELEWRAPYVRSGSELADPVARIAFTFLDDALYQIVVGYDRDRTDGLTSGDIIDTLSTAYGAPAVGSARTAAARPAAAHPDASVLAQWETAEASVTLVRGAYTPEFQLILMSKPLTARARNATREAIRLDAADAPRREADRRKKEAAEANAAREKTRATNKAAFRP